MDCVLRGLSFATTYTDDVLIYSPTPVQHVYHLEQVFKRLQEAGLTLRGAKCQIGGHIFDNNGMHPDPSKINCVRDCLPLLPWSSSFLALHPIIGEIL